MIVYKIFKLIISLGTYIVLQVDMKSEKYKYSISFNKLCIRVYSIL